MAQKQTVLGRIAQLARANIHAMLDAAEDPEKMLDQMIRDYRSSISEAEEAIAQTIGNLRLAEQDRDEDQRAAKEWEGKALAASRKADELRAQGQTAEADRFDGLARIAIERQLSAEAEVRAAEPTITAQTEVVDKLKTGLQQMKAKLDELQRTRDQLVARQKSAAAQAQVHEAVSSIDLLDPTSEISRFEEKVRREEAMVAGRAELASSSLESQFEELKDHSRDAEVEARLAELKARSGS
ncbi:PspA/IM30 family protein [Quadrisphaera sp. GCM10027208]|uniref:PspA/IM30 family protein n=1 Tax=Quadrisphaera sp. GCM10027208 TaxID=3273423 RepID=UPI00360A5437